MRIKRIHDLFGICSSEFSPGHPTVNYALPLRVCESSTRVVSVKITGTPLKGSRKETALYRLCRVLWGEDPVTNICLMFFRVRSARVIIRARGACIPDCTFFSNDAIQSAVRDSRITLSAHACDYTYACNSNRRSKRTLLWTWNAMGQDDVEDVIKDSGFIAESSSSCRAFAATLCTQMRTGLLLPSLSSFSFCSSPSFICRFFLFHLSFIYVN